MALVRWLLAAALAVAPLLVNVAPASADSEVTADNKSEDSEAKSGDVNSSNNSSGFTGQQTSDGDTVVRSSDVEDSEGANVQEGDNSVEIEQESNVSTGDAVAGQVIGGVVEDGDLTINATNVSEDVSVETGDATGTNTVAAFVGLVASGGDTTIADIENVDATNILEGDNDASIDQSVNASSGDGVGGQVLGAVVNGGSTDITAANRSEDVDIETGEVDAANELAAFVGLNASDGGLTVGLGVDPDAATGTAGAADVTNGNGVNVQEGDNDFDANQSATSVSGDGVAGQVLGVVSAGDTTIDASNVSTDVDVSTGEATTDNRAAAFVGLAAASSTAVGADIDNVDANNIQEGDNSASLTQASEVVTGDAVAGQVAGVVTSAGGSTDVVLDNVSEDADLESGDGDMVNLQALFTGLNTTATQTVVASERTGDDVLGSIFNFATS